VEGNLLYYGDNLDVLRRHIKDESVDLIYLDPPFNSNASYNVLFAEHGTKSTCAAAGRAGRRLVASCGRDPLDQGAGRRRPASTGISRITPAISASRPRLGVAPPLPPVAGTVMAATVGVGVATT